MALAGHAPATTPSTGTTPAAFGIYEYWHLTKDAQALEYFRGAATTAQRYAGAFRNPGWLSFYCLAHHDLNPFYHNYHVGQLLELYRMTGAVAFARYADQFSDDYPRPGLSGHHDGRAGPLRRRAVRRSRAACARAGRWRRRARAHHARDPPRPGWSPAASSTCVSRAARPEGWWLAERPGRVYADEAAALRTYDPVRPVALLGGRSYRAVQLDKRRQGRGLRGRPDRTRRRRCAVNAGATVLGYPMRAPSPMVTLAKYWLRLGGGAELGARPA